MEYLLTSVSMVHHRLAISGRHTAWYHLVQTLLFYRANYRRVLTMTPVCQESDHSPEIYSVDLLGTLNMNTPSE